MKSIRKETSQAYPKLSPNGQNTTTKNNCGKLRAMNVLIMLGNGFNIDFIKQIKKHNKESIEKLDEIDFTNLFKFGDSVIAPDGKIGMPSPTYCPVLWELGARPNMPQGEAYALIEEIISCINLAGTIEKTEKTYIKAYRELLPYVIYLMRHYNKKIQDDEIKNVIDHWGWSKLFKLLDNNKEIENIYIITLNYDIFLERILDNIDIKYDIAPIENNENKFKIIKLHGSISLIKQTDATSAEEKYKPTYDYSPFTGLDSIVLDKKIENKNTAYAIIPPAGDAHRYKQAWETKFREKALSFAKSLKKWDKLIISGISYWHVDRREIDEILMAIPAEARPSIDVLAINPNMPKVFNNVITTIFDNVKIFSKSDYLG